MAQRSEIAAIYFAGVVQGVALVTFPAASAVFTSRKQLRPIEHGVWRHVCSAGRHRDRFVALGR